MRPGRFDKEVNISRLCTDMGVSRLMLRRYREERREAVRRYVGRHWSEDGYQAKTHVNLIALWASILGRNLIAQNPRIMLSVFERQTKPVVAAMETWINKEIVDIRFANTMKRVVMDALFSFGCLKVGLASPADAAAVTWHLEAGQPFAERVDLDDFVCDMRARDFNEVSYIGHRIRVPLDTVKDSKLYNRKVTKNLSPAEDELFNEYGDERIGVLGKGFYGSTTEGFEDMVDLWEVYLPRHKLVVTLEASQLVTAQPVGGGGLDSCVRVQNWLGRDSGPYHILGLGTVPGNLIPKAPVQDLIDLHDLINNIYRKLGDQAERQKELLLIQGGADADGSRVQQASDGEVIRCDNPDKLKVASFGMPNQNIYSLVEGLRTLFSWAAGNLDMMGGLSPQSKTLGQDKMLEMNASRSVSDMQDTTVNFVVEAVKSLTWYWWHHPTNHMNVEQPVPGTSLKIPRTVTPQQRQGPMPDVAIDPYSLQHQTPQMRQAALDAVFQQIVPLMPLLQQQGISIDLSKFLELRAKFMDMPDLASILTIRQPPAPPASGGGGEGPQGMMPQNTTRTYNRVSGSGADPNNLNPPEMAPAGAQPGGAPSMNGAIH